MSLVGTRVRTVVSAASLLRVVWAALLALTVLATIVILFTTPLNAGEGEFIHALRTGEVGSVAVGSSSDFQVRNGLTITNGAHDDIAVSWVNRFGFRRSAVLNGLMALRDPPALNDGTSSGPPPALDPAASITATARSLGATPPAIVGRGALPFGRIAWLPEGVLFLMIAVMLLGPQPRRMTRWGAFWAYTAPLNSGIFYALLRDSPWNQKMNRMPEPRAGDRVAANPATGTAIRRLGGWKMFIWAFLLSNLALSLVLLAVTSVLPQFVDPVVWTGIDVGGHKQFP